MYKRIYLLAFFFLAFVGTNILTAYGFWGNSFWSTINPALYILIVSTILSGGLHAKLVVNKHCIYLFVSFLIVVLGKIVSSTGGAWPTPICFFLIPFFFCFLLDEKDNNMRDSILKLLISFFIIDCVWGICEKITMVNVFPQVHGGYVMHYDTAESFRSSGLQGSALTNSLCLTAIYLVVLISRLKNKYKLILFGLGYISLMCYNTRTSMILWPVVLVLYYLFISKYNAAQKFLIGVLLLFFTLFVFNIASQYSFGLRLFSGEDLIDDSANVRLDTIAMFFNIDIFDLFFSFGYSGDEMEKLMFKNDISIIENSWILHIFWYGGLGLVLIVLSYYKLLKHYMHGYSKFQMIMTLGAFLLLGSTNNGLKEIPLTIFLLSVYSIPVTKEHKVCNKKLQKYFED